MTSVKANTPNAPPTSRFPLGPGDAYLPGTLFSATNQPLITYIRFAFAKSQGELLRVPAWAYHETFDIQGRASGDPTKDDMRPPDQGSQTLSVSSSVCCSDRQEPR